MLWLGKLYIFFFKKKDDTAEGLVHLGYVIPQIAKAKIEHACLTCKCAEADMKKILKWFTPDSRALRLKGPMHQDTTWICRRLQGSRRVALFSKGYNKTDHLQ